MRKWVTLAAALALSGCALFAEDDSVNDSFAAIEIAKHACPYKPTPSGYWHAVLRGEGWNVEWADTKTGERLFVQVARRNGETSNCQAYRQ